MHRASDHTNDDITEDGDHDESSATYTTIDNNGHHYQLPPPGGGGTARTPRDSPRSATTSFCCDMRHKRENRRCHDCYEMTNCNSHDSTNSRQLLENSSYSTYNDACSSNGDVKAMLDDQVRDMKHSLHQLKANFVDRVHTASHTNHLCKQWRDVALVLDRLFFIMYIILIVVSLSVLFPRPKY